MIMINTGINQDLSGSHSQGTKKLGFVPKKNPFRALIGRKGEMRKNLDVLLFSEF